MIGRPRKLRGPQLYTPADVAAIANAAAFARSVLDDLLALVRPGADARHIGLACREILSRAGVGPAMEGVEAPGGDRFGWPCSVSIDDTVAHARPASAPLRAGQLVTIDLMTANEPWCADVADTVVVGGGGHELIEALDAVWAAGVSAVAPGVAWAAVAGAMAEAADAHGVRLIGDLAGHGIGLAPHELPILPLVPRASDPPVILRPGMVFTLEPAITSGTGESIDSEDGWAIRTADGAPAVGREAMIAVLEDGFRVLGGPVAGDSAGGAGYNPHRTGPGSGE